MAFNKEEEILVPFRTWRNTTTGQTAAALSDLFVYNIPLRWSSSHLYQAILDNEEHVSDCLLYTSPNRRQLLRSDSGTGFPASDG